jgi:hypothetical protein
MVLDHLATMPEWNRSPQCGSKQACYSPEAAAGVERSGSMGFFFFIIGVIIGVLMLVLLPLFIAVLGVALAVGIVVALPLIAAVLVLVGIIAVAPAVGYGLAIAALLIALVVSDRKRRQPRWPVPRNR